MEAKGPCLETVRALHQTVVALRAALEESKREILKLKIDNNCDNNKKKKKNLKFDRRFETKISIKSKNTQQQTKSLESLTILKTNNKSIKLTKNCSLSNLSIITTMNEQTGKQLDEPEEQDPEQEVDDIELIFTTDETKDSDFKEQLVSIEQNDTNLLQCPISDLDSNFDNSDRELDDDVFNDNPTTIQEQHQFNNNNNNDNNKSRNSSQIYNSKSDNSINHDEKSLKSCYSYQDSSFENKSMEKDESFDQFDDRIRIIETDISKCGIQDVEYCTTTRRNTCPNPLQYRPLVHREALAKGLNVQRKARPILVHSNAIRKESGAQTDISALPGSAWLSESNLANKSRTGENFTTLPSKFPLPGTRLKLSEKTVEARRVLLSDIGFTSMVPELSRSADHLCPTKTQPPAVTTYGQFLKATDFQSPGFTSQRFTWTTTAITATTTTTTATPSDSSHSQLLYPLPTSPPVQSRRCSAPVSPSKRTILRQTSSKVRFANGSLPELRSDWTLLGVDSGDSTDSLVEEAENYLRRSIDCLLSTTMTTTTTTTTRKDHDFDNYGSYGVKKTAALRRASAPESSGDNVPPQGWQPFLPRLPRDLKPDHWVKVITAEGRVRGGRVRYVGPIVTQTEQFVGVQLATPEGTSDGTYNNRRYFQCEPCHGIFVPFKKVIMGWRP